MTPLFIILAVVLTVVLIIIQVFRNADDDPFGGGVA